MKPGFHSAVLSDMLTHRQLNVERVKSALHGQFNTVSSAVFDALFAALLKHRVVQFNLTNKLTLSRIVADVLSAYDAATRTYVHNVTQFLATYVVDESTFFDSAIRHVAEIPGGRQPAEYEEKKTAALFWPFIIAATGFAPVQSVKNSIAAARVHIQSAIQQAHALGYDTAALLTVFRGSVARLEKDSLLRRLSNGVNAIVDTVVQAAMVVARNGVIAKMLDYLTGYTWVSVLDSRTSAVCRSLSGRVFEYGKGPLPPMHPRCRSHIEPIFSVRTKMREGFGRVFDAGETFYKWLSRQPETLQDDVLGPTRGKLFRNGGLTADQFAVMVLNRRYQPLTLAELRKKNPEIFARAGV